MSCLPIRTSPTVARSRLIVDKRCRSIRTSDADMTGLGRGVVRQRYFVCCFAACILLWPTTISAGLFGDVGKAVGGFFRSVGNVLGQGLAGFAQPTIEDTANQFQKVALSALQEADRVAGRRIDQLSEKLSGLIEQTDDILQKRLRELDEILSKKLGAVDIIGTKQIFNFEQSIISIVKYASMLFLTTAVLIMVASYILKKINSARYDQLGVKPFAILSLAICALSGVGFISTIVLRPPSQSRLLDIKADLVKSYQFALQLGDLSGATYYASQVNVLDSSNLGSRLLVELADLQRDLLSRPALLKSARGSLELNARVARLDRTWDLIAEQKISLSDIGFLAHELPATAAMIGWQSARVEADEALSACAALGAIKEFEKNKLRATDASPFMWLAYSYVKWTSVRMPKSDFKCPDGSIIRSQLAESQKTVTDFDSSLPNPVVQQAILYNRSAAVYYSRAAAAYTSLIVADTQARWKANKAPYISERDKAADELVGAWGAFIKEVQAIPGVRGSNIVLALNGMPLALSQRAFSLKGADPAGPRPVFDVQACNATVGTLVDSDPAKRIEAEKTRYGQFLSLFDPLARNFVCTEQGMSDTRIVSYENALVAAVTKPGVNPIVELGALLNDPGIASFSSSLIGCVVFDSAIAGERGCKPSETPAATSLAGWIKQGGPPIPANSIQRVAFVR